MDNRLLGRKRLANQDSQLRGPQDIVIDPGLAKLQRVDTTGKRASRGRAP